MKTILLSIFLFSFHVIFSQVFEDTPWLDVTLKKAFKQGQLGSTEMWIQITGKDEKICNIKAKKAAVYISLFENTLPNPEKNIPAGLALTDQTNLKDNPDFYPEFFKGDKGEWSKYAVEIKFHPTEIAEIKLDRKTVQCNYIVTVNTKDLYTDLSTTNNSKSRAIIKNAMTGDVPPALVLVVPEDSYCDGRYSKEIDAGGYMTTVYDYVSAVKDELYEDAIKFVASQLTGEGTGLKNLSVATAMSAIEKKDAEQEMESGNRKQKISASERLRKTANWDYTVKVKITEKPSGSTGRSLSVTLGFVDMYTNIPTDMTPINMVLSSSGEKLPQIQKVLQGPIEEMKRKMSAVYTAKVDKGINGSISFIMAGNSKKKMTDLMNFDGEDIPYSQYFGNLLSDFSATDPELNGTTEENSVKYDVAIKFWTTKKSVTGKGEEKKAKNSYEATGLQLVNFLTKQFPGSKFISVSTKGSSEILMDLK